MASTLLAITPTNYGVTFDAKSEEMYAIEIVAYILDWFAKDHLKIYDSSNPLKYRQTSKSLFEVVQVLVKQMSLIGPQALSWEGFSNIVNSTQKFANDNAKSDPNIETLANIIRKEFERFTEFDQT